MEFVIETDMDRRAMRTLSAAARRTMRKGRRPITFGWVLVGVNLALAALLYLTESGRWQVNLLLAFTMLVPVLMVDRINGRAGMGQVMPGSERVTATFQEERYIHVTQASESSYPYDRVQAVCESTDYFILLLGGNYGQVYDKRGFVQGTPMTFRDFICRKTGKPVQSIR